jgi:hypothetical protein
MELGTNITSLNAVQTPDYLTSTGYRWKHGKPRAFKDVNRITAMYIGSKYDASLCWWGF